MRYILVIDAGTTSLKAAIYDDALQVKGLASREFEVLRPTTDCAELNPEHYWSACVEAIQEALRGNAVDVAGIAAIAVTSHTDTLFVLDENDAPVANAILWSDPRAQRQAERIQGEMGLRRLYRTTGQTGASSVHFAARIARFTETQGDAVRRVARFLQTQDYLIYRLTGQAVVDHSIACCSLLAHLDRPAYWAEMLALVGVEEQKLSRIVRPGAIAGGLKPEIAKLVGLRAGLPVIAAAMDATAGVVAVRSVAPESIADTTGAALVIGAVCDAPQFDPRTRVPVVAHAAAGQYLMLPWNETGGAALRWFRDQFFVATPLQQGASLSDLYDRITAEAAEAPPGCDGVTLLPHFAGSGSPDFNPAARACIYGLTMGHERKHISRAFLEAVAFLVKRNLNLLAELGLKVESLTCAGGGSRSALWCQIKADVTGLPVRVCPFPEVTAAGAAIIAMTSLGLPYSVSGGRSDAEGRREFVPQIATRAAYDAAYERFNRLDALLQTLQHSP